ncbi:MAG TPA: hypothetical protein VJ842_10360 [Pyrinomonadaceae bacterium]|nr:hypothetical protein [Pyrinomonadaceae bacterium]
MAAALDRDELKRFYDAYRDAYMNEKYYARRLTRFRRLNDTYEAALAIGASGTIGSWQIWNTSGLGGKLWAAFGGVVALMVVLKPFFRLASKAERSSKLYIGYKDLHFDLESLVEEVERNDFVITPEMQLLLTTAKKRYKTLALEDEIEPIRELVEECQKRVNEEVPAFSKWCPAPPLQATE